MYYEDVDLSLRGAERGWEYRCIPASRVVHEGGVSASHESVRLRTTHLRERNRLWVALRFRPLDVAARALWLSVRRLRWAPRRDARGSARRRAGGDPAAHLGRGSARRALAEAPGPRCIKSSSRGRRRVVPGPTRLMGACRGLRYPSHMCERKRMTTVSWRQEDATRSAGSERAARCSRVAAGQCGRSAGTASAEQTPVFIPRDAHWLTTVNYYRQMAGLGPVVEDATLSVGRLPALVLHAAERHLARRDARASRGYTRGGTLGRHQRQRRRVERLQRAGAQPHRAVDDRSVPRSRRAASEPRAGRLRQVRHDAPRHAGTPARRSTCCTVSGRRRKLSQPILFPGNGTTTNLNRFIVESPDPLPFCGWSGSGGPADPRDDARGAVRHGVGVGVTGPSGSDRDVRAVVEEHHRDRAGDPRRQQRRRRDPTRTAVDRHVLRDGLHVGAHRVAGRSRSTRPQRTRRRRRRAPTPVGATPSGTVGRASSRCRRSGSSTPARTSVRPARRRRSVKRIQITGAGAIPAGAVGGERQPHGHRTRPAAASSRRGTAPPSARWWPA